MKALKIPEQLSDGRVVCGVCHFELAVLEIYDLADLGEGDAIACCLRRDCPQRRAVVRLSDATRRWYGGFRTRHLPIPSREE